MIALLAGYLEGTDEGAYLQDLVLAWLESSSAMGIDPYTEYMMAFNPYATRGDRTASPDTVYASGRGMVRSRTGWTTGDSWFLAQFPPWLDIVNLAGDPSTADHVVSLFGSLALWKGGAWAFDVRQGYLAPSSDSRGTNGLSIYGLGAYVYGFREYRKVQAYERETTLGDYVYITGTEGGSAIKSGAWSIPGTIAHEHTRSVVYFPPWDLFVVHDRANVETPIWADWDKKFAEQSRHMQRHSRMENIVLTPVSPTLGSGYVDWAYSGANHSRVTHLLPTSVDRTIVDEYTEWQVPDPVDCYRCRYSEQKYQVQIVPSVDQQWHTFLNVWDVYGNRPPHHRRARPRHRQPRGRHYGDQGDRECPRWCSTRFRARRFPTPFPSSWRSGAHTGYGCYSGGAAAILDDVRIRTTSYRSDIHPCCWFDHDGHPLRPRHRHGLGLQH